MLVLPVRRDGREPIRLCSMASIALGSGLLFSTQLLFFVCFSFVCVSCFFFVSCGAFGWVGWSLFFVFKGLGLQRCLSCTSLRSIRTLARCETIRTVNTPAHTFANQCHTHDRNRRRKHGVSPPQPPAGPNKNKSPMNAINKANKQ